MKKTLLSIILVYSCLTSAAFAAQDKALEAMETLRRGFAGISDFTADITQEKQLALMKQRMVSKGVVRFKKPGTFFMELYSPYASRLLLRDNVLNIRLPAQGVSDRLVLPPDESLEKWFACLARPLTSLPEGVDVKAERQGNNWTMQVFPRSKGGVKELQLNFDLEGRIKRLVIEERNRDRTVIRFANMRRNVGLKEKDFQTE